MFDIKRVNYKLVVGLPTMMSRLTRYVPSSAQAKMLECGLNRFFHNELKRNELAFMSDKQVVIAVSDIGLQFGMRLHNNRLRVVLNPAQQDFLLKAEFADFIAMISNQVDPDTLFFRRRLQMLGDTELGLYCKNLLDSIGPERLPKLCQLGLSWLAQQQNMASDNATMMAN